MLISLSSIPLWVLWVVAGIVALAFTAGMNLIKPGLTTKGAVIAVVGGLVVAVRMLISHGSPAVALIIYSEALVTFGLGLLTMSKQTRAEVRAQPEKKFGLLVPPREQYRMLWVLLALVAVFITADVVLIGGFVQKHT